MMSRSKDRVVPRRTPGNSGTRTLPTFAFSVGTRHLGEGADMADCSVAARGDAAGLFDLDPNRSVSPPLCLSIQRRPATCPHVCDDFIVPPAQAQSRVSVHWISFVLLLQCFHRVCRLDARRLIKSRNTQRSTIGCGPWTWAGRL